MSRHLSEKFAKKLDKEGILIKDNGVRFTVTHMSGKGKVLGRDWYKGFICITEKRLALVSEGTKFLNIKSGDERFDSAQFIEDNVACLEVKYLVEPDSKRSLVLHIYSSKAHDLYKRLQKIT
ncbi:MAG: hypothetical protein ACRBB6_08915 [Neptuniibacter sp.]